MLLQLSLENLLNGPCDLIVILSVGAALLLFYVHSGPKLPLVNGKKAFEFRTIHARMRYLTKAKDLMQSGFSKGPAYRLQTDNGIKVMLSPEYAYEIRNHENLSFPGALEVDFHSHIKGLEPFGNVRNAVFLDALRTKLTQSLAKITEPLSFETEHALQTHWTDDAEWHDIKLGPVILKIVAQLSSKVFLGDQICRNPDWLRVTIDYSVDSFVAAQALCLWPRLLRPVVASFLPACQKVRAELQEARDIVIPVLQERRLAKQTAINEGRQRARYVDAMEWMEECAGGRQYDPAAIQLTFSLVAIHTSSDMLTQALYDLSRRGDLVQELREEVVTVLKEWGWSKQAMYNLKLMDSFLKESQRLKPLGLATMNRLAEEDIKLSDGTLIRKGEQIMIPRERMWDANYYGDPETFDARRFLNLRSMPGHEASAQLVAPSVEHMGFGFGKHACPGRFFAAHELKIILCHILLKYDLKLAEGCDPEVVQRGHSLSADRNGFLSIRRRKEDFSL